MAEHVTIKPQSEPLGGEITPPSRTQTASLTASSLTSLCVLGLLVSFFLPWVNTFLGAISGFDLQKMNDEQKTLWLIPIFCVITIIGGITGKSQRIGAQVTGALPFLVLIYWLNKSTGDVMHALSYGAYLSLIFGLLLFILPRRLK